MNANFTDLVWWTIPLWSAGCMVFGSVLLRKRACKVLSLMLAGLAVIATVPLAPGLAARMPKEPPTQVIYRFDDHRWLELKGWECEGALWYLDSKLGIKTEVVPHSYRIVFYRYVHPSTRYIAIPVDDFSGIWVSQNGGKTFGTPAHVFVPLWGHYDSQFPMPQNVKQFVVANDRGFIEMKDGRVLQSSLPMGEGWGKTYLDYPVKGEEHSIVDYDFPEFQDLKSKPPEVKSYAGWTHMQCDPKVGIVPKRTSLAGVPGLIYSLEAYTLGAPIYFGSRIFKKNGRP
ncbi:hypothetical protein AWB77_05749 [Caballeronia fortuita]|uniref:Tli3-like domain-containing protein n=1 Tax=Caballeronia fortuita TaxID=1777138 RepID=A0A158DSS6_9BURK|nr:hypothetical protein [Caballeronia fortuita]SAK97672.1 hypothetical protein AWB77_05749 [Caballeronia fortuita]